MRLTTKFSAFITLLTGLTIFVTLLGCSLSFYTAIQDKLVNRVQSVASVIDTRLLTTPLPGLSRELDELMVPVDIVQIDILQGKHRVLSHERPGSYRPAGVVSQYREVTVHSLKNPGMTIYMVYLDPMASYFRSMMTTAHCRRCVYRPADLSRGPLAAPPALWSGAAGDAIRTYPER